MKRTQFISIASGTAIVAMTTSYFLSDRNNLSRTNLKQSDEKEILFLASLAPSAHNS